MAGSNYVKVNGNLRGGCQAAGSEAVERAGESALGSAGRGKDVAGETLMEQARIAMGAAAVAGGAGALLMAAVLEALRSRRLTRLDVLTLVGTVFSPPGPKARLVGLAWHVTGGLAFGIFYATLFDLASLAPTLALGAALGLAHGLLSGLSLLTLPFRNRRVAVGEVADPGPFALNFGLADSAALIGAHVIFGAAFALLYPPLAGL